MPVNLNGLRVLVTRPQPFGEKLCALIQSHHGMAIYFPTITIKAIPLKKKLVNYDWLIFTSPQAVYHLDTIPKAAKVAAIGKGTKQALQEAGMREVLCPNENWTSEGLLELLTLHNLTAKKIALIKGQGGRELLVEELKRRGANVTEVPVYQRILPIIDEKYYLDLLQDNAIDMVICTSNEGMQNLKKLLIMTFDKLANIPLIVVSDRMKICANELGFKKIYLAKNASQESILETLAQRKKYDQ